MKTYCPTCKREHDFRFEPRGSAMALVGVDCGVVKYMQPPTINKNIHGPVPPRPNPNQRAT